MAPIAMPTSARINTGASLMPSPAKVRISFLPLAVSYTHLDVYKRQFYYFAMALAPADGVGVISFTTQVLCWAVAAVTEMCIRDSLCYAALALAFLCQSGALRCLGRRGVSHANPGISMP